jgi:hypothetical protein
MTDLNLTELKALAEKATAGPLGREDDVNPHMVTRGRDADGAYLYVANFGYSDNAEADIAFFIAVCTALPALIESVGQLQGELHVERFQRAQSVEALQSHLAAVEKDNAALVHLGECVVDEFAGAEDGEYPAVERLNRKLEPYRIMRSLSPSVPGAQEPKTISMMDALRKAMENDAAAQEPAKGER